MFNPFKRKEPPSEAIREAQSLLNKSHQVKEVALAFMQHHLSSAEGVIIIWVTEGEVIGDTGGLCEADALGCMDIIAHRIKHEGIVK